MMVSRTSQLSSLALLFLSGCPRSSERVDGDFDIGNVRLVSSSAIGLSVKDGVNLE